MSIAKRGGSKLASLGNGFYCMSGSNCDFKPVVQSSTCNPSCPNMVASKDSLPVFQSRYEHFSSLLKEAKKKGEPQANIDFFRLEADFYADALKSLGVISHA